MAGITLLLPSVAMATTQFARAVRYDIFAPCQSHKIRHGNLCA
jgi:hypothetical protein